MIIFDKNTRLFTTSTEDEVRNQRLADLHNHKIKLVNRSMRAANRGSGNRTWSPRSVKGWYYYRNALKNAKKADRYRSELNDRLKDQNLRGDNRNN